MNYYNEIKNELINNEITKKVKDYSKNKSDLTTYYNVARLLSEAGKHYGESIINQYSLTKAKIFLAVSKLTLLVSSFLRNAFTFPGFKFISLYIR